MLAELRALLERDGDQVCAVVIEPLVQAAGGDAHPRRVVRAGVRALCDEFGALMVVDEVATGIGRTGRMWAVEHAGVSPDLMTCGKGLTGGYLPLSAVLAREEVYEAFLGAHGRGAHVLPRPLLHREPALLRRGHREPAADGRARDGLARGARRRAHRRAAQEPQPVRRGARDPAHRHDDRHRGVAASASAPGFAVCQEARRRGVWVRPLGDVVVLMPPLAIGDDDLALLARLSTTASATVRAMSQDTTRAPWLADLRDRAARERPPGCAGCRAPRRPPTTLLDLACNDYLGLARDKRVVDAAVAAHAAVGRRLDRLPAGHRHDRAARRARAATSPTSPARAAGLVFSSGYLANLGAVTALAGADDTIVSDALNHASIVDACRLAPRHASSSRRTATSPPSTRRSSRRTTDRALVVTDAVFSVDGDVAPLAELHAVARRHGALLLVDEAHALGVVGAEGRGGGARGRAGRTSPTSCSP